MRASTPDAALRIRQYQNFALSLTELRQQTFRLSCCSRSHLFQFAQTHPQRLYLFRQMTLVARGDPVTAARAPRPGLRYAPAKPLIAATS